MGVFKLDAGNNSNQGYVGLVAWFTTLQGCVKSFLGLYGVSEQGRIIGDVDWSLQNDEVKSKAADGWVWFCMCDQLD